MIKGLALKEREYRALPVDSASTIQTFAKSPQKYYKKYILGEAEEEEDTRASLIGSLVHCLILEPFEFEKKFFKSDSTKAPSGKMGDFVNALIKHTEECIDEDGVITKEFNELFELAYVDSEYKYSREVVLKNFTKDGYDTYYQQQRDARATGLKIVTLPDMVIAEGIVETLKNHPYTEWICNIGNEGDLLVTNEVQFEGFEIEGIPFKMMIDKIHYFVSENRLKPYDYKITWEVENFYDQYYMKKRCGLQMLIYWLGLQLKFPNLKVEVPTLIVADSANFSEPIPYRLTEADMQREMNGYIYRGKWQKGLKQIIEDLKWHKKTGRWGISRENATVIETDGFIKLVKE